jgi:hypothetical protein
MEQKTVEHGMTIFLRLVGVLTIFIGLIWTSETVLQLLAARAATSSFREGMPPGMSVNLKGAAGRMGGWAVGARLAVVIWGTLMLASARSIARGITREEMLPTP